MEISPPQERRKDWLCLVGITPKVFENLHPSSSPTTVELNS